MLREQNQACLIMAKGIVIMDIKKWLLFIVIFLFVGCTNQEYEKEITLLKEKYKSFQNLMNEKNLKLNKLKDESAKLILKNINEIISEYSAQNSISMIVEKKSIIIGKSELNITKDILDLLNKKIKKIELQ